jgi:TolB protein
VKPRELGPGQQTRVWTTTGNGEEPRLVWETGQVLLEAPNWAPDGVSLILNGDGVLWRLDLQKGSCEPIPISGVPDLNNDHVLAPDGQSVYVSANDWHIYRAPLRGGPAVRVSDDATMPGLMHFLHGVSPDGSRLAFIGLQPVGDDWWARANVFTMSSTGGGYEQITHGTAAWDGSEYSPDGGWIYGNTEAFDGHAQIARMRPDGSELEQLTFDDRVNWFPHLSPDGRRACYVSFEPGTEGHPPDVWVEVKIVQNDQWSHAPTIARIFGGQGSLNVNGWSPDSTRFAYVDYPLP